MVSTDNANKFSSIFPLSGNIFSVFNRSWFHSEHNEKSAGLQKREIHPTLITNPVLTPQVSMQKDLSFFYIMQWYELTTLKTDCKVYTLAAKADLKVNGSS